VISYFHRKKRRILEIIREESFISLFKRPFRYAKRFYYTVYLMVKIKNLRRDYTLDSLIDFCFLTCEGLIKPFQKRLEILVLLEKLKIKKPRYILEIGTAYGGTLFLVSRVADRNAIIISLDLPSGIGDGFPQWKTPLFKTFSLPNQNIYLVRGNSHNISTVKKIQVLLNGNKLDFLFIDGDHSYEGVKRDFKLYSPLVKKSGIIALHDIVDFRPKDFEMNVNRFWNEIKENYNYEEIVDSNGPKWMGIGVLKGKIKY
jgi:cephalosporin hydroxylase